MPAMKSPLSKDLNLCHSAVSDVSSTMDRDDCEGGQAEVSTQALAASTGRRKEAEPGFLAPTWAAA